MAGRGFRPFRYDYDKAITAPFPSELQAGNRAANAPEIARVLRVTERLKKAPWNEGYHWLGDLTNHSLHHELLLAVTESGQVFLSEVNEKGVVFARFPNMFALQDRLNKPETRFEFEGYVERPTASAGFRQNPLNVEAARGVRFNQARRGGAEAYSSMRRNCQMHVSAILRQMNFLTPP
jgi:hypothetical protein